MHEIVHVALFKKVPFRNPILVVLGWNSLLASKAIRSLSESSLNAILATIPTPIQVSRRF